MLPRPALPLSPPAGCGGAMSGRAEPRVSHRSSRASSGPFLRRAAQPHDAPRFGPDSGPGAGWGRLVGNGVRAVAPSPREGVAP